MARDRGVGRGWTMNPLILAIDPGPVTSGVVWYLRHTRTVMRSEPKMLNEDVRAALRLLRGSPVLVAVERVRTHGRGTPGGGAGGDVLRTAEESADFRRTALESGHHVVWLSRRDVLGALGGLPSKGSDAAVRRYCIDVHASSDREALGTKAAPGPLYGVTSHAWQALGLALAVVGGAP